MTLKPPNEDYFDTKEELFNSVQQLAQTEGYAIVTRSSRKGLIYLQCDRGGTYKNCRNLTDETRKRKPNSKLINCQFMLRAKLLSSNQKWHLTILEGSHNHPPSFDSTQHSILRRLNDDQKFLVYSFRSHGKKPKEIVNYFRNHNLPPITVKDVHNLMKSDKAKIVIQNSNLIQNTNFEKLIESVNNGFEVFPPTSSTSQINDNDGNLNIDHDIDLANKRRKIRKPTSCSRCHQIGHTRAHPGCPKLLDDNGNKQSLNNTDNVNVNVNVNSDHDLSSHFSTEEARKEIVNLFNAYQQPVSYSFKIVY